MIFVNDGLIQFSPHPLQLAFDLTALFKAMYDKAEDDGLDPQMMEEIIIFAQKLSKFPDEEIEQFLASLPSDRPIGFDEIIDRLDNWRAVPMKNIKFYS